MKPAANADDRKAGEVSKSQVKAQAFQIIAMFHKGGVQEETLRQISDVLYLRGFVTAEYGSKVIEREKEYPTGLPTTPVYVAIPHSDKVYACRSVIAVVRLGTPVQFRNMGAPEETLPVDIIFLLAVPPESDQVLMIQTLMHVVQDETVLTRLMHADTEQRLADILHEACTGLSGLEGGDKEVQSE